MVEQVLYFLAAGLLVLMNGVLVAIGLLALRSRLRIERDLSCEVQGHRWREMSRAEAMGVARRLELPVTQMRALNASPDTHGRACVRCPFIDLSDREGWEVTDRMDRIEAGR